ncbi:MAG: T9SS type A sorting domain-containing protein [Bacteroidota bacterium]
MNEVELWITDAAGNQDFCITSVFVQDNMGACSLPASSAIAGALMTEDDDPVEGAMVEVNGGMTNMMSEIDGSFSFDLGNGGDYTVTPMSGDDWMNGVTTWDLVLIMRHILGVQVLDSPYKLIAADANHSDAVTTADIVEIQKVILGFQPGFINNTSWRYIDQDHQFANWQNPWSTPFNEFLNFNNLANDQFGADFVAVKIGDVNGSVQANSWSSSEDRTLRDQLRLGIENRWLEPGEMVQIPVWIKEEALLGMQATLEAKNGLEIVSVTPSVTMASNFAQAGNGSDIRMSWYQGEATTFQNELFFYLNVVADRAGALEDMLGLVQDPVTSEAYRATEEAVDLELVFLDAEFAAVKLYQNRPNPFKESTVIGFDLPESGVATLEVINTDGKILQAYRDAYPAGYHEVKIDNLPLGGVLYYRLRTEAITLTRKMIILNK